MTALGRLGSAGRRPLSAEGLGAIDLALRRVLAPLGLGGGVALIVVAASAGDRDLLAAGVFLFVLGAVAAALLATGHPGAVILTVLIIVGVATQLPVSGPAGTSPHLGALLIATMVAMLFLERRGGIALGALVGLAWGSQALWAARAGTFDRHFLVAFVAQGAELLFAALFVRFTQRVLIRSESRYRKLFEEVPVGVFRTTTDGVIVECNDRLAVSLGFAGPEELTGANAFDRYADLADRYRLLTLVQEHGHVEAFDTRLLRRDGTPVWCRISAVARYDAAGTLRTLDGAVQVTEERKRAEDERRLIEQLTLAVVEAASIDTALHAVLAGIGDLLEWDHGEAWAPDGAGHLEAVSTWDRTGVPPANVTKPSSRLPERARQAGRPVWLGENDAPAGFPEASRHGLRQAVALPVLADGRTVAVLVMFARRPRPPLPTGLVEALTAQLGLAIRRKQAEAELVRRAEFERIVAQISSRLVTRNLEGIDESIVNALEAVGRFADVDRGYLAEYRAEEARFRVSNMWVRPGVPQPAASPVQDTDTALMPWIWEQLGSGRVVNLTSRDDIPEEQAADRRLLETLGIASLVCVPMLAEARLHAVLAFDTVDRAVTWSEEDVGRLHLVAEMLLGAMQRAESYRQVQSLVRSKDEFVASVSHELRTPLTAVVGLADELRFRPEEFDQAEIAEFVATIADQAHDVAYIVEDLLVIARGDLGNLIMVPAPVDLRREIAEVITGLSPKDRVTVVPGTDEIRTVADPTRIRQVLRNLISNALRYGGPHIVVEARVQGGEATVVVRDDGTGIPTEEADQIFDPYWTGARSATMPASIGLGLTVAQRLARLMGGDVAYSREGGWTRFAFSLRADLPRETSGAGRAAGHA